MGQDLIVWLGCGVLAVSVLLYIIRQSRKKEFEFASAELADFKLEYYSPLTGWHGHFYDENIKKSGVIVSFSEAQLSIGNTVRVLVLGMCDGVWQVQPLKVTHLPEGECLATGESRGGLFKCIYSNPYKLALVGWVITQTPLEKGKKYSIQGQSGGYFIVN